jgi:hypothetical protein
MIAKLRGRSVHELRDRLTQRALALADRHGLRRARPVPTAIDTVPQTPFGAVPTRASLQSVLDDTTIQALVARADRVVSHTFDVLGLQGLSYGSPPDWQCDPLTQRRAADAHWTLVPYLDYDIVGDHKITWEINRHQWLLWLGQAWQLTGDDRYPDAAADLLRHWLGSNPPKRGMNWTSALELAFRVQAWVHAMRLFAGATVFDASLRHALVSSAYTQVKHVEQNLSTWFSPNTHLTGEALALLIVGTAWPALPDAAHFRRRGWSILCSELPKQLRNDGVYFEQSAWYQTYTLEFYLHAMRWARLAGLAVPDDMAPRVRSAARALRLVTRPDGSIARLGDDDGGRFLPLGVAPPGHMGDALALAALDLEAAEVVSPEAQCATALVWLVGAEAVDRVQKLPRGGDRSGGLLPAGGWVVLTEAPAPDDPSRDHWLVFDAGPHGALSFAHAHADALSIDLSVRGVPMIVDPGTGAYVGEARARYRSTAAHATVTVDGRDSSEQGTAFRWITATDAHLAAAGTGAAGGWAAAWHDGYAKLTDPVRVARTVIRLSQRYWIMLDTLTATGSHVVSLTLPCAPDALVATTASGAIVRCAGVSLGVAVDPQLSLAIDTRAVSPAYAAEVPASALVAHGESVGTRVYCTLLADLAEQPSIALGSAAGGWAVRVGDKHDRIFAGHTAHGVTGFVSTGEAVIALDCDDVSDPRTAASLVAFGAGTLTIDDVRHDVPAGAPSVFVRSATGWARES